MAAASLRPPTSPLPAWLAAAAPGAARERRRAQPSSGLCRQAAEAVAAHGGSGQPCALARHRSGGGRGGGGGSGARPAAVPVGAACVALRPAGCAARGWAGLGRNEGRLVEASLLLPSEQSELLQSCCSQSSLLPADARLTPCAPPTHPPAAPAEEELFDDPWKLLVACMLLNKTTAHAVGCGGGRGRLRLMRAGALLATSLPPLPRPAPPCPAHGQRLPLSTQPNAGAQGDLGRV